MAGRAAPYWRAPCGDAASLAWRLFLPALNEERVVGGTIDLTAGDVPAGSYLGNRRRQRGQHCGGPRAASLGGPYSPPGAAVWADPAPRRAKLPHRGLSAHSRRSHGLRQDEA